MEKKILYLEIDEEITSVIDRLKKTAETDIHLVVPKEAALLQSIVNLKLLKRQADTLGKQIQIITHDKVGRNLAEQVGIHSVSRAGGPAGAPQNLPEKLEEPDIQYKEKEPVIQETKEVVFKKEAVDKKPEPSAGSQKDELKADTAEKPVQKQKTKDLVPKFPYKKFFLIALASLIALSGLLFIFLPMTKVGLRVVAETKDIKADITIDGSVKDNDNEKKIVSGNIISAEKDVTKTYQATGKKNIGKKASGTITVNNTYSTIPQTLVAGTRFQTNGLVFKTQSDVNVPGYQDLGGGNIKAGQADVSAIAESPGDDYNIGASSFRVVVFSGTAKYDKITGTSSGSMTGGTTKEVRIITATDISNAQSSFDKDAKEEIRKEGQDKLGENEVLDEKAIKVEADNISFSKSAGSEADDFTGSAKVKFTGISYSKDDISRMLLEDFKSKMGDNKQIFEDKINDINVSINNVDFKAGTIEAEATATVHLGTKIDENQLKDEIKGSSEQKAREYLEGLEGVESVDINFWPGFMKQVARLKSHIYVKTEFIEQN